MKNLKKILALVTALALTLALALPAFAADGDVAAVEGKQTIEINGQKIEIPTQPTGETHAANITDHTFNVYQIFDAAYAKDADGNPTDEIVSIKWGTGIQAANFFNALKATDTNAFVAEYNRLLAASSTTEGQLTTTPFANIGNYSENSDSLVMNPSAYEVAKVVASWGTGDTLYARAFAAVANEYLGTPINGTTPISYGATYELKAGYYLVKDMTEATGDNATNLSILAMQYENNVFKPQSKVDVPELEKKVLEVNDSNGNNANDPDDANNYKWSDVADYDLNDTIPFVLTGTLPTDYASYETYYYQIADTMSNGLVLNPTSIKVLVNGRDVTTDAVNVNVASTNKSFTVTFNDLKTVIPVASGTDVIQVVYTATLSAEGLVVGGDGNVNTAHLTFSNNPSHTGEGEPKGTTPDDKVTVFTFELTFDKTGEDADVTALFGAGFSLYKYDEQYVAPDGSDDTDKYRLVGDEIVINEDDATDGKAVFDFKGLDAGNYKLVESTVPAGYNRAEDMYFTITPTYGEKDNTGKVTDPQKLVDLTFGDVKDSQGNVIKAANGDNMFTLSAQNGNATSGIFTTTIQNLRGLTLPSTGGIGTTIFYVVGGLLVLGAGVLLITKKRMGRSE